MTKKTSPNKLGIIVPYRNRYKQLILFKRKISEYMTNRGIDYELIVVEQDDAKLFNRGMLLNIGFEESLKFCNSYADLVKVCGPLGTCRVLPNM